MAYSETTEKQGPVRKTNWIKTLFRFTEGGRGKLLASLLCALIGVAGSFVPYLCIYQIIDMFVMGTPQASSIAYWCALAAGGYVIQMLFNAISTMLSHYAAYETLERLRLAAIDRLAAAPLGEVQARPIGNIKNLLVDAIEAVEPPIAHMIPEFTSNVLLVIAVFGYLLILSWPMGLALLVTPVLAFIPLAFTMRSFNKKYAAYWAANERVNSVIVEYVEGIEVIKAFNQSTRSYTTFSNEVASFKEFTLDWFKSTWASMNITLAFMPTTLLCIVPVGVALFMTGSLTPSNLAMCFVLSLAIVAPLARVTTFINEFKAMQRTVDDVGDLLEMPVLPEVEHPAKLQGSAIRFRDVSFSYDTLSSRDSSQDPLPNSVDTPPVADAIHAVSLDIPAGSFFALVGPSGGGKTTLARLLVRFWDVREGSIEIGGIDIRRMPLAQLADTVSYVTQDNFLFDCSLRENIRLGRPSATDEEVLSAAAAACCDEFIGRLPHGYDTPAGEAGKLLSGGERQRITIARALLKRAPIVVLDEATAFIDPENEENIQRAIAALVKGKTLLVIAHRLSTVRNADTIIVLRDGRIEATGTQDELLASCSLYRDMWEAHTGAKTWAVSAKGGALHV